MQMKAILFDLDGTLVDTNDMHVLAWEEAFLEIGAVFSREDIHDQIGKGTDMLVPSLVPGLDQEALEQLGEAHGAVFKAKFLGEARPFPRAHDLLAHTRARGQRVVLASSAAAAELDHYIELLHARDLVDATTSGDDVAQTKPAPDIFATALAKLPGVRPEEAMVVGDTPYDVEAAAKCGMATVAVRSGKFSDETLRAAGAVAIYDDVAALLADFDNSPLAGRAGAHPKGTRVKLTGRFDTRRDAEMSVERLVQEYGIDRNDVSVAAAGDENSAGTERGGSDDAAALEPSRGDAAIGGQLLVTVVDADVDQVEKIISAFAEFASEDADPK